MSIEDSLIRRLAEIPAVRFALVFGSRAGPSPRPGADLDLAVYLDPDLPPGERFGLRLRIAGSVNDLGRADIVILNDAPPLLGHRALQGRLVYARDRTDYVRYFIKTISASEDERYWRGLHRRARERRIREGRFGRP